MINDYAKISQNIMNELEKYCIDNNMKSLVIGVSGGIDSAVVCALAKPVCGKLNIPLIGRYIGIVSNSDNERERAKNIGLAYCHDFDMVKLDYEYSVLSKMLEGDHENKIANGNVKARMRMIYLYDLAGKNGGMVLGTDNRTEYQLGFWTKNGDDFDYNLIHGLWKTEVYGLADNFYFVNSILRSLDATNKANAMMACINADATDGLGISKTDLDQIMPDWRERHDNTRGGYEEVDEILKEYLSLNRWEINGSDSVNNRVKELQEHPVIKRHISSSFKRRFPISVPRSKVMRQE